MATHKNLKSKEMTIFISTKMTAILKLSDKNFKDVMAKQSKQAAVALLKPTDYKKS